MNTVTSKDGTRIAFDRSGAEPTLIIVAGSLQYRAFDQGLKELAALLAPHFTVVNYDRRGRGDSTDTPPYALEREIEDIEALIDTAGGSASLYGVSSGAALALEATLALPDKATRLALYEPPYSDDQAARQSWRTYRTQLDELLADGRRGDAVALFMTLVGLPADQLPAMRQHPDWPIFEAVAPTLAYDAIVLGEDLSVPTERAARVAVPTLVMNGGANFSFMHTTAVALAKAMPQARQRTLEGQTHEVSSEALAPVLIEFFTT